MKKLLCALLCVILAASAIVPGFAAAADDPTKYPCIVITGYSSSYLEQTFEDGSTKGVWKLYLGDLPQWLLENIAEVGLDAGFLALGDPKPIVKTFTEKLLPVVEPLRMNPDGTSVYQVDSVMKTARDMNMARILAEEDEGMYWDEPEKVEAISEVMGGYEHMYFCYNDFRRSVLDCSDTLDRIIEEVLEIEHAKKVNVIGISHGGQVLAFYLARYGEKNRIHNAVLSCPAIGGAAMAWDAFNSVHVDFKTLMTFIENGNMVEEDINWLRMAALNGYLDEIIAEIQPEIMKYVGNWGSLWDFIPCDKYDEFRSRFDLVEYAGLMAKSDIVHYEILPTIGEKLNECRKRGMNISITCGTGSVAATGYNVNSDGIIPVYCATGATTPEFGKRFSDGYTAARTICSDASHGHVSPSMEIDASTGWLPDNTWYIEGLFHAMDMKDPTYSTKLMLKLLLTDDLKDVYTDPAYPQFRQSANPQYGATVAFDASPDGFVSGEDKAVVVTNVSDKYPMSVISLRTDGMDLLFNPRGLGELAPGESVTIPFTGTVPQVSGQRAAITVTFRHRGNPTPVSYRTVDLTIMNGEQVPYDESQPYSDADFDSVFSAFLSPEALSELDASGMLSFLEMIYDIFYRVFRVVKIITALLG